MKSSRNRLIILVIILIVVAAGGWYFINNQSSSAPQSTAVTTPANATPSATTGGNVTTTHVPTQTSTGSHTTTPTPVGSVTVPPQITAFEPSAGSPGTQITITGTNFSRSANYIMFGPGTSRYHTDGSPDNQIAVVASANGTSITFTVPTDGPSGLLCDAQNQCDAVSAVALTPGNYPVTVRTAAGTSNTKDFVLIQ